MIRWWRRRRARMRLLAELYAVQHTMHDLEAAHDAGRLDRAEYWPAAAVLEIRADRLRAAVGTTRAQAVEFARTGRNWGR